MSSFPVSRHFTMVLMQQYQIYFWVLGGVALIIGLSIWYKQFYQFKIGDGDKI
jgi:hypothetical protein